MEKILAFALNDSLLAFILWYIIGFMMYWISVFMKQIFYWRNDKKVSPFFFPLEDKEDYLSALIFSIFASFLGFLGLFFIIISIKVMRNEIERSLNLDLKRF